VGSAKVRNKQALALGVLRRGGGRVGFQRSNGERVGKRNSPPFLYGGTKREGGIGGEHREARLNSIIGGGGGKESATTTEDGRVNRD